MCYCIPLFTIALANERISLDAGVKKLVVKTVDDVTVPLFQTLASV